MGYNRLSILSVILILIFSNTGIVAIPNTDVEEVITDQTSAIIGNNTGELPTLDSEVQFLLETNMSKSYELLLWGSEGTDFDLRVNDHYGNYLATAVGTSYPDITQFNGTGSEVIITVYSYSGTGNFTLEIQENEREINLAVLGSNYGELTTDGDYVDFVFNTNMNSSYILSLWGSEGTDFDLSVADHNGNRISSATGVTYPDSTSFEGTGFEVIIGVYSYSGTGNFTLEIQEYEKEIKIAQLGMNYGEVSHLGPEVDFIFQTNDSQYYDLALTASDTSNYLGFYVENSNYEELTYVSGEHYPLTQNFLGDGENVTITVFSHYGTGNFTLEILIGPTPQQASLGENLGTLESETQSDYWMFDTTYGQWYEFSITADENTDFDMRIGPLEYDYSYGSATGINYPDSVDIQGDVSVFGIEVYSFSGSGPYVLTITEIAEPATLLSAQYSSEIRAGNSFVWEVSHNREDEPVTNDYLNDGDIYELEFHSSGDQIIINQDYDYYIDNQLTEATTFSLNDVVLQAGDDNYFLINILVLPTTFDLSNGQTVGLLEGLNEGYFGYNQGSWHQEGDEVVLTSSNYYNSSIEYRYDIQTGILNLISISDYLIDFSINLVSSSNNNSEEPIFSLPLPWVGILISVIAVPLTRRKLLKLS